ncbi:hypothetical protein EVAR_46996_1 [Eumeta japonica]|uniref:Uncharacterized protein n=1 Tax=Eumeta variegata TaxID=151549 RepID=A0A4C1X6Z1_EUMVA|nr:hypothetical protein EVAR_46996_1 [Eumeta japonica]
MVSPPKSERDRHKVKGTRPFHSSTVSPPKSEIQRRVIDRMWANKKQEGGGAPLPEEEVKVVLVGDAQCGKTALVQRFVSDHYTEVDDANARPRPDARVIAAGAGCTINSDNGELTAPTGPGRTMRTARSRYFVYAHVGCAVEHYACSTLTSRDRNGELASGTRRVVRLHSSEQFYAQILSYFLCRFRKQQTERVFTPRFFMCSCLQGFCCSRDKF